MKQLGIFAVRSIMMGVGTYFVLLTAPWLVDTRPLPYEVMVERLALLFIGYGFLISGLCLIYLDWKKTRNGK